ncbi:hypothetical protein J5226_17410 [Lysobacter sp. K5869]|uniref:hypothetical protein n=1 Tax=Lysobacter sp. K5869 TaxID=2820808 RepID=UPI001C061B09|nr:hypothetical protein [Lysobacter sp. K5869]QWP75388.1 hypothetical protein J5226_17410 [Lysobacter sp. K5869]
MKLECQFRTVKPNESCTFQFSGQIMQQVAGINQFSLSFGSGDHHVKTVGVGLSVNQQGSQLTIVPKATLVDSSGNSLDPSKSSIGVVSIAIVDTNNDSIRFGNASNIPSGSSGGSIVVPCAIPSVLQSVLAGFNLSYSGGDHHMKAADASVGTQLSGTQASIKSDAQMYDGSGNFASGTVDGGLVASCDTSQPLLVVASQNLQNSSQRLSFAKAMNAYYALLTGFNVDFSGDDHHVQTIGASFSCASAGGNQVDVTGSAVLHDGSGHVQDNNTSYVTGVVFGF